MARRQNARGPRGLKGTAGSMGPRGKTGARGPQGARGRTGPIGRRGKIGKPGKAGPNGLKGPQRKDPALEKVMTHFDDVYLQLDIQMKRIAQMQQQLDLLIADRKIKPPV